MRIGLTAAGVAVASGQVEIDRASWRDINAMHRLQRAAFGPDAWSWLEVALLLVLPRHRAYVARTATGTVGMAALEVQGNLRAGCVVIIAVAAEHRQQGIGTLLLDACERDSPFPKMRLTVNTENSVAQAIYTQRGYRVVRSLPRYYPSGADGYVMEKVLPPRFDD